MIDDIENRLKEAVEIIAEDERIGAPTMLKLSKWVDDVTILLSLVKRLEENNQSLLNDNNQLSIKLNNLKDK